MLPVNSTAVGPLKLVRSHSERVVGAVLGLFTIASDGFATINRVTALSLSAATYGRRQAAA
ncbi:unnamed protein product [Gemmata massiliana]|uniref:Uncharacterized protein n=1 Tax=Gemmata massiliana TaxID=1210884 RepID=A0A6P2CYM1_9BACT|nr:unnamed protein product [Gemmata massiliana]